ncbi:hypothetical protein DM02DRAFT_622955 [Periconia macrospinosa]|uniref:Uncharacterized protein n=1 Tax=Periconia macrospinosa TaxID=97972 RepID=A0A2V1E9G8_9PLEO|nr:hypothetical protein DM02DRAFT_622955 [Periconia macrospinosa]
MQSITSIKRRFLLAFDELKSFELGFSKCCGPPFEPLDDIVTIRVQSVREVQEFCPIQPSTRWHSVFFNVVLDSNRGFEEDKQDTVEIENDRKVWEFGKTRGVTTLKNAVIDVLHQLIATAWNLSTGFLIPSSKT